MIPKLTLKRPIKNTEQSTKKIGIISTNQMLEEGIEGIVIYSSGTWIYFDIRNIDIPLFYTSLRVIPVVTWTEKESGEAVQLIHPSCYFIGNTIGTAIWTILTIIVFFVIILYLLSKRGKGQILGIICDEDGSMSMSLVQMGLWTIFVGTMIVAFGLLRMKVPDIPDTLIMLMLFAAGTTTAGQFQTKIKLREEKGLDKEKEKRGITQDISQTDSNISKPGKFSAVFYSNKGDKYPSIAKIQVLFWTVITLLLFVYLSINEEKLWDIPSELVILMGISQATFLSRQQMAIQDVKGQITDLTAENNNIQDASNLVDTTVPNVPPSEEVGDSKKEEQ